MVIFCNPREIRCLECFLVEKFRPNSPEDGILDLIKIIADLDKEDNTEVEGNFFFDFLQ